MLELIIIQPKFLVAGGMCLFGATVHTMNGCVRNKEKGVNCTKPDAIAIWFTALFAGMIFGLLSLTLNDTNDMYFFISVSAGSFLGYKGLTRVTDLLITLLTRK